MASGLDSNAYFLERVHGVGLGAFVITLEGLGITTMAEFAFSANYVPGRSDETGLINELVIPLLGEEVHAKKPAVRRLFVEAYSLAMSDATRRVTQPEGEDKPRKLPLAERAVRLKAARDKFNGIKIENNLEPSWALIDKFVEMLDFGEIRPLPWEELTRRNQETLGKKKENPLYGEDEATGHWKRMPGAEKIDVYVLVDSLMAVQQALRRRGMALHLSRLMNYEVHETLVAWYFEEMEREPLDNHAGITLQQIRMCDREIWLRLGRLNQAGFQGKTWQMEKLPLDDQLATVIREYRIIALLNQLPLPGASTRQPTESRKQDSEKKRLNDELNSLRSQLKKSKNEHAAPVKQGGGKKQGGAPPTMKPPRGPKMPRELIGCNWVLDGQKLCFDFNLAKGCSNKMVGACSKGLHRCAVPGCGEKHSAAGCSKR